MEKFRNIIKQLFSVKILVIIIILVFLLTIILPASYYFITIDDGTWDNNEKGRPSSYTQNAQITSTSNGSVGIVVNKETIIKDGLINLNYTEGEIAKLTEEEIIEKLDINNKLKKDFKVTSLDEITQSEILWCLNDVYSKYLDTPEELEKLLNAEIITQFPKIDSADEGVLNGIIEFQRNKTDGTSTNLTYMDKNSFEGYINSNSIKTSNGNSILNYFTLDDEGNAIVAAIDTEIYKIESNDNNISIDGLISEGIDVVNLTEDNKKSDGNYYNEVYTVESKKFNYKSMVQSYTMPFQYLWALLVVGGDKEFVLELADLVEDSEITISLYDNIATTEYEDVYTYKKETRIDKYAKISVDNDYGVTGYLTERYWLSNKSPEPDIQHYTPPFESTYITDENEYNVTMTKICKTNSFVYDLTKANVWVVNYSKDYEYLPGSTEKEENSKGLDNTEYVFDKDTSTDSTIDSSLLQDSDALSFATSMKTYIERKAEENKENSSNTLNISGNNLNSTESDIDTEEEIDVNVTVSFVRYKKYIHKIERKQNSIVLTTNQKYVAGNVVKEYKVDINADEDNPNFVTILNKPSHKNAKYEITAEVTSWLMEILETNSDTKNMVELTKLLINKVSEKEIFKVNEDDIYSEYDKSEFNSTGTNGNSISLTEPTLDKESFIAAMKAYAGKNTNFDSNFLPYAAEIYDWSVASGIDPELVIITARLEGGFGETGGSYNYWGIGVYNGSSSGTSYSSLKNGIEGYAQVIRSYQTGDLANRINQLAKIRQAEGVDPLGYGSPDTLSGMQSIYSNLGSHIEGSSGAGGYYYMDPAIAGVTRIYATHAEFLSNCKNSGLSEHKYGTPVTAWENGQYTAWQVEKKLKVWNDIFGAYGSLSVGNESIIETAKSKIGCPYVWRS